MNNDLISKAKLFNLLANVWTLEDVYSTIQDMPTEEAEKVIRCKECKHADFGGLSDLYCMWNECHMYEDDYCSYAERENET